MIYVHLEIIFIITPNKAQFVQIGFMQSKHIISFYL